jgi:pimeloyl-ACP methyl ester carboxylesterase
MSPFKIKLFLLAVTTLYQAVFCLWEDRQAPPGQRIDIGGYQLHLCTAGEGDLTIVVDHSLGGIEGYLLMDDLAKFGRVVIYDRAGYGWSDRSPYPRCSDEIVDELDTLLTKADIQPPYILVGDSFGSYNVRLYAHRFPEKVLGLVLTDGLHESGMLKMSLALRALKLFFISGFVMSALGSALGIIQVLRVMGAFEWLKPGLRQFSPSALRAVTRSFCRPKHWITMTQEMLNLDVSARQLQVANDLGDLPIVSIHSASFFKPSWWTALIPLQGANQLREQMHQKLAILSTHTVEVPADHSSHFVWVDEPQRIGDAVMIVRNYIKSVQAQD